MKIEPFESQEDLEERIENLDANTLKTNKYTDYETLLKDLDNFVETGEYMINFSDVANLPRTLHRSVKSRCGNACWWL